jgi:hypothetical protein
MQDAANRCGGIWRKKDSDGLFDVAMGSYMGAEICDLLGLYILDSLSPILGNGAYGLYRDDGLAVMDGRTPSEWERLKKSIRRAFQSVGFKITIETGLYQTDFLDVILDLRKDEFRPFRKNNASTVYINNGSNHPGYIRSSLPEMTRKRISGLSKHQEGYDRCRAVYDEALTASGFSKMGAFESNDSKKGKRKQRRRNVLFFHPPYCASVTTKVGKSFLRLVDKHFPPNHQLSAICNRNTLKVSYSVLPNVKAHLQRHNSKVLSPTTDERPMRLCNCKKRACPVDQQCLTKGVVYKATVTTCDAVKEYIGSSCDEFKSRYRNHISSFNRPSQRRATALAGYIHDLKDAGTTYDIKWEFLYKHGVNTRSVGRCCGVCNLERLSIALADKRRSLNKRSDMTSKCQHLKSLYL